MKLKNIIAAIFSIFLFTSCSCGYVQEPDIYSVLSLPFSKAYAIVTDLKYTATNGLYDFSNDYEEYLSIYYEGDVSLSNKCQFIFNNKPYSALEVSLENGDSKYYFFGYYDIKEHVVTKLFDIEHSELVAKSGVPEEFNYIFSFSQGYSNLDEPDFIIKVNSSKSKITEDNYLEIVFDKETNEITYFDTYIKDQYSDDDVNSFNLGLTFTSNPYNTEIPTITVDEETIEIDDEYLIRNCDYFNNLRNNYYSGTITKFLHRSDNLLVLTIYGSTRTYSSSKETVYFLFNKKTKYFTYIGYVQGVGFAGGICKL